MVAKIKVAAETHTDKNFQIIARTDARTVHGLDEALRRMEQYAQAGADILFIESPESIEEMEIIGKAFDLPLVANMVETGRTPVLTKEELQRIGFGLVIFPSAAFLSAGAAFKNVYEHIKATGSSANLDQPLHDFQGFSKLMGFDWVSDGEAVNKEDIYRKQNLGNTSGIGSRCGLILVDFVNGFVDETQFGGPHIVQ
eukprot:gene35410-58360_t